MEPSSIANYLALCLYAGVWIYLMHCFLKQQHPSQTKVVSIAGVAILVHCLGVYGTLVGDGVFYLGVFKLTSLFFLGMNLLVFLSSLKKPLHNLFIFLFPLTAVAILASEFSGSTKTISQTDLLHLMLAVMAMGFLTVATLQALFLAYQDRQLKHKHVTGAVALLPPMQTMEKLMFEMLWVGVALLSLLIVSGLILTEDIRGQKQGHTLILSILAWIIYAILFWGRMRYGWRGTVAVKWIVGGFICLFLAYFGTQVVYQIVLG